MSDRYGASPEDWQRYVALGLTEHLLPVVSNPRAAISSNSKMKALGKTPSWYNGNRQVAGIPDWTSKRSTPAEIERWSSEPDYGICVQTRMLGAIDIDVPNPEKAERIARAIAFSLPTRWRALSGKCLRVFKRAFPMPKRVIPVDGGIIEFLGDGQQFIAEGTHPEGVRYQWAGSLEGTPELASDELETLWLDLVAQFSTSTPRIARQKRAGKGAVDLDVDDPIAEWLNLNWEIYDVGSEGQLFIECPFEAEHTTDSGATATAYFVAGTGGYEQGHFVCLHAHCAGRGDEEYLDATGYSVGQFEDLGPADVPAASSGAVSGSTVSQRTGTVSSDVGGGTTVKSKPFPVLKRDKQGRIEVTADNLVKCVGHPGVVHRHLAFDAFRDELVWAPNNCAFEEAQWRVFGDSDMVAVQVELERRGFHKLIPKTLLRDTIHAAADDNRIDTAQTWLERLRWDGTPRVETFAIDCWGWKDNAYSRAVGRYTWTALAGRVIEPGVRADMAPILVGAQGLKKTSAIQAMVPSEDFYAEVKLDERDDNLARILRGKLVGELEELRGLSSRASEEIKAFVSRKRERWVPKFKEYSTDYWRRVIFIGSSNPEEFLGDPTGERRWLPGKCGEIDIERVIATRDQLWAEGAVLFAMNGVEWEQAERLATLEHKAFKINDTWERAVYNWLMSSEPDIQGKRPLDKGWITIGEALAGAIGVPLPVQNRGHELRIEKALRHLGLTRRAGGEGEEPWVWEFRTT